VVQLCVLLFCVCVVLSLRANKRSLPLGKGLIVAPVKGAKGS
jgi:hypothetical protein